VTTATPRFNGGGDNRFVLVSLVAVTTALLVCYSGGGDNRFTKVFCPFWGLDCCAEASDTDQRTVGWLADWLAWPLAVVTARKSGCHRPMVCKAVVTA
jgi:hypothetical protein